MAGLIDKLKDRWELKTLGQLIIVLIVFAFTGTTVMVIKKPLTDMLFVTTEGNTWFTIGYWILILPIYNMLLLFYGFIFGQFRFFWNYERKFFNKIFSRKKQHRFGNQ